MLNLKHTLQFRIRGEILDNIRKEWGVKAPEKYKKQKELVTNKIAEYVDSVVNGKSSEGISIDKLLTNSMMIYMVSIDDISDDGVSVPVEDKTQKNQSSKSFNSRRVSNFMGCDR